MKLIFFILIDAACLCAVGQSRGYAGFIRIGTMSVPDARNVLPRLAPGINGFSAGFTGIGGELEYTNKKTVFDCELMILSTGPVNSGDRYAEPFTGAALIKGGYLVVKNRNFWMYPNAGVGFGSLVLNTYEKAGNVKQQLHSTYLLQPIFDLGISSNVIVYRFRNTLPTGILPVGLRGGYRFAPASDNWHRSYSNSTGINYSMQGWYLSIALGMGYISSNQNTHK